MLRIDFEQLFFYHSFSRGSENAKAKVANVGQRKDQDEESSGEEEEDLEEVSENEADEKDEGELSIEGENEDQGEMIVMEMKLRSER